MRTWFSVLFAIVLAPALASGEHANRPSGDPIDLGRQMVVHPLAPGSWVVTTEPWAANSLLVETAEGTLVLVDTPTTPGDTERLLGWIDETFGPRPMVAFNGHYHIDCLGGNQALAARGIPIWGSEQTVDLLSSKGEGMMDQLLEHFADDPVLTRQLQSVVLTPPDHVLAPRRQQSMLIGGETVEILHPGAAHSPDNILVFFPDRGVLFGGCMIKDGDSTGNVAEADLRSWRDAVEVAAELDPRWVVPGHGTEFGPGLIANTRELVRRADKEASSAAIRSLTEAYGQAFASTDSAAVAGLFWDDADLVTLSGGRLQGRAAIADFYAKAFQSAYADARMELDVAQIRFEGIDNAIADSFWHVEGEDLPANYPVDGLSTMVLTRRDGQWLIWAARTAATLQGHTKGVGWPERPE